MGDGSTIPPRLPETQNTQSSQGLGESKKTKQQEPSFLREALNGAASVLNFLFVKPFKWAASLVTSTEKESTPAKLSDVGKETLKTANANPERARLARDGDVRHQGDVMNSLLSKISDKNFDLKIIEGNKIVGFDRNHPNEYIEIEGDIRDLGGAESARQKISELNRGAREVISKYIGFQADVNKLKERERVAEQERAKNTMQVGNITLVDATIELDKTTQVPITNKKEAEDAFVTLCNMPERKLEFSKNNQGEVLVSITGETMNRGEVVTETRVYNLNKVFNLIGGIPNPSSGGNLLSRVPGGGSFNILVSEYAKSNAR